MDLGIPELDHRLAIWWLGGSAKGDWSKGVPFLWTIVAALALFVAWRVVVSFRRQPVVRPAPGGQASVNILPQADQLLEQSRIALAQGDHRAAVRLALLSLLAWLQDRGQLKYDSSRSNREYQQDLRRWPESATVFGAVAAPFERCWYGGRNLDDLQVQEVIALLPESFPGCEGFRMSRVAGLTYRASDSIRGAGRHHGAGRTPAGRAKSLGSVVRCRRQSHGRRIRHSRLGRSAGIFDPCSPRPHSRGRCRTAVDRQLSDDRRKWLLASAGGRIFGRRLVQRRQMDSSRQHADCDHFKSPEAAIAHYSAFYQRTAHARLPTMRSSPPSNHRNSPRARSPPKQMERVAAWWGGALAVDANGPRVKNLPPEFHLAGRENAAVLAGRPLGQGMVYLLLDESVWTNEGFDQADNAATLARILKRRLGHEGILAFDEYRHGYGHVESFTTLFLSLPGAKDFAGMALAWGLFWLWGSTRRLSPPG